MDPETYKTEVDKLIEKWAPVLDAEPRVEDYHRRGVTAFLLENQHEQNLKDHQSQSGYRNPTSLLEAAPTNAMGASSSTPGDGNIDIYDPILISLVRRSMPNLIAYDLIGVQPMAGPTGLVFALRSRYRSQTGTEALYNEANTAFAATQGLASNTEHQTSNSQWVGHSGQDPTDIGNYLTQTGYSTAFGEALGDSTDNPFPEMALEIEKLTVTAVERALKAEYTVELAQDLKAIHGLDAESELANILSAEILTEINREVIRSIIKAASTGAQHNTASAGTFNLDVDANGRWSVERFKGLVMQIEREANQIAKDTRRGKGNWILCGSDVASALRMTGLLEYNPQLAANLNVDDTGNTFAGVLNGQMRVYIDPYFRTSSGNEFCVVGYKGSSPFDAGMFYCPYVPLQMFRAVGENSFQPKIAFKTRYGLIEHPFSQGTTQHDGSINTSGLNVYFRRFTISNLM